MTVTEKRSPQRLFNLMRRHPYLLTVLLCGILLPFGFADRAKIHTSSCIYLGIALGVIAVAVIFLFNLGKNLTEKAILTGVSLLGITAAMLAVGNMQNKAVAVAIIAVITIAVMALFIRMNFLLSDTSIIALMMLLGIAIRFVYVLYTGSADRQHDVGFWNHTWGHANYIEYWYNNGLKLPDFDVRSIWQYYHPPFHHWLMALLLRALTTLGVEYKTGVKSRFDSSFCCKSFKMLWIRSS